MEKQRDTERVKEREKLCVTKHTGKLFTQDTVNGYCVQAK